MTDLGYKTCTNKSFKQFIIDIRVAEACKLLMKTQYTVHQICFKCGFHNLSNFNRLFKKYKGSTPNEFRKNLELSIIDLSNHKNRYGEVQN